MPRRLWIDASAGVAGDMLLGALLDAGASLPAVEGAVGAVAPGAVELGVERVTRAGLAATQLRVRPLPRSEEHRAWRELRTLLDSASLPEKVRMLARATFAALAAAEAQAHGVPEDEVHFHEVGAWDSIADVVGVAAALDDLGVDQVSCTAVGLGSGTVRTAHGVMPVPVPAVLALLGEAGVEAAVDTGLVGECATPTGVALLAAMTGGRGPEVAPWGRILGSGTGAGSRDPSGRANVVRVVLHRGGDDSDGHDDRAERLVELAATVDDLDPRVWPVVLETLLGKGALDAWLVPVLMKKGRPGTVVHALARPQDRGALVETLLQHTSSLGVRWYEVSRTALDRVWRQVQVGDEGDTVRVKLGLRDGVVQTATPEFEDALAAAELSGRPLRHLLREIEAAAEVAGYGPGAAI
ncbi:nickel pincer cofactor biosynthesis protein LarC [uncultured Serinicoccus sp.]|uniref:nickel pincer cofactor biosynthesis protein LarC n=1 Tax=uncultured Serinicoccus sp. TaxID=735514 RepID=UPI0026387CC2|nr:nickel pincer cofactor biosynthesis protein LarC [uncultured Serinicoccus sp.]